MVSKILKIDEAKPSQVIAALANFMEVSAS